MKLGSDKVFRKQLLLNCLTKGLLWVHEKVRFAFLDLYSKLWIFVILSIVASSGAYLYGFRPYFIVLINLFIFAILYEWSIVFIFIFSILSILAIPLGIGGNTGMSEIIFANAYLLISMVVGVTLVKYIAGFHDTGKQKIKRKESEASERVKKQKNSMILNIKEPISFGFKFVEDIVKLIKKNYKKKKGKKVGKIKQIKASKRPVKSKFRLKRRSYRFDCSSKKKGRG